MHRDEFHPLSTEKLPRSFVTYCMCVKYFYNCFLVKVIDPDPEINEAHQFIPGDLTSVLEPMFVKDGNI